MERWYEKLMWKVKEKFGECSVGNSFIVDEDRKKDKFE